MSSCCGASPTNARDLAQHALAQLLRRQVGVGLDEPAQPRLAEQIVARVHRLADAVGEEQVEIAGVQRDRLLDQQALEHLAVVELQADHHAVRREDLHLPRRAVGARAGHVDQRRVAGARVGHRPRAQIDDGVGHRDEAARVEVLGDDAVQRDQHRRAARCGSR